VFIETAPQIDDRRIVNGENCALAPSQEARCRFRWPALVCEGLRVGGKQRAGVLVLEELALHGCARSRSAG
jgi:hypothetical protein